MNTRASVDSFIHFVSGFLLIIAVSFSITFAVNAYLNAKQKSEVAAAARAALISDANPFGKAEN